MPPPRELMGSILKMAGFNPRPDIVRNLTDRVVNLQPRIESSFWEITFDGVFAIADNEGEHDDITYLKLKGLFIEVLGLTQKQAEELLASEGLLGYFDWESKRGFISRTQFVRWITDRFIVAPPEPEKPAASTLRSLRSSQPDTLVLRETGQVWKPPTDCGIMNIEFVQLKLPPGQRELNTDPGIAALVHNLQAVGTEVERAKIFETALRNSDLYLQAGQAQRLVEVMSRDQPKKWIVELLLPTMANATEASILVRRNLSFEQTLALRMKMGTLYLVCLGNPSGHYNLDLSRAMDRKLFNKLGRINSFEKSLIWMSSNPLLNTSQKGNGDNFRNESLNGQPITVNETWFTERIPSAGRLRFDYVSTVRPPSAAAPLTIRQFSRLRECYSTSFLSKLIKVKEARLSPMVRRPASAPHARRSFTAKPAAFTLAMGLEGEQPAALPPAPVGGMVSCWADGCARFLLRFASGGGDLRWRSKTCRGCL